MTASAAPRQLVLFDLDHTLIPLDSDYEWASFLARRGHVGDPAEALAKNELLMQRYDAGTLTAEESAEFMLGLLARNDVADLAAWHEIFMAEVIRPAIAPQALQLVRGHLQAGDLVVLASSTNTFVISPIARAFGIRHVLGTEPEEINGRYTGKFIGTPCFQAGKITRVDQWLAERGWKRSDFEAIHFYSDSTNDLPLLEVSSHPIATNPSDALRQIAESRQWRILDLFA